MIFNIFWWKSAAIYDHRNLWEQSPWNRQQSFGNPSEKLEELVIVEKLEKLVIVAMIVTTDDEKE